MEVREAPFCLHYIWLYWWMVSFYNRLQTLPVCQRYCTIVTSYRIWESNLFSKWNQTPGRLVWIKCLRNCPYSCICRHVCYVTVIIVQYRLPRWQLSLRMWRKWLMTHSDTLSSGTEDVRNGGRFAIVRNGVPHNVRSCGIRRAILFWMECLKYRILLCRRNRTRIAEVNGCPDEIFRRTRVEIPYLAHSEIQLVWSAESVSKVWQTTTTILSTRRFNSLSDKIFKLN